MSTEAELTVIEQLRDFLNGHHRNQWLLSTDDEMQVYVRHAHHLINGQPTETLDIANVEVATTGKGTFTRFLEMAERLNPHQAIFIENVMSERFANYFRRRGWGEMPTNPPCFYRMSQHED